MKPEEIKDLRELLGTIEFANAKLEQSVEKLEQFKDIEKLVPILENLREIDLSEHLAKINFAKIGEEVFAGVKQSLNSQNTIITNSIQSLQQKSQDLHAITQDLQELDELSRSLDTLKKGIQNFNLKMIAGSLIIGLCIGTIGGYTYSHFIQAKPFEKLLSKRAYTIEETSNGFKDILVITSPYQIGNFKDGSTWISFTYPMTQTAKKEQK